MTFRHQYIASRFSALATLLFSIGAVVFPAFGQDAVPRESTPPAVNSQESARRQILESDRWKNAGAQLNEWLSVQQVYTPDEVAAIKGCSLRESPRARRRSSKNCWVRWKKGLLSCRVPKRRMPECGCRSFLLPREIPSSCWAAAGPT